MSLKWYVFINGETQGPFSKEYLHNLVNKGELTPEHYVWTIEQSDWIRAKEVSDLFSLPPPPPMPSPPNHLNHVSSSAPPPVRSSSSSSLPLKKNNSWLILSAVVAGVLVLIGGLFALGWWGWSYITQEDPNGVGDDTLFDVSEAVEGEAMDEAMEVDEAMEESETFEEIEPSEHRENQNREAASPETTPDKPDYGLVENALIYYFVDLLKHENFYLLSEEELTGYDMDDFYDKYAGEEVWIYRFDQTGNEIKVDMGEPYSEYFFGLILEWDDHEWEVVRYVE